MIYFGIGLIVGIIIGIMARPAPKSVDNQTTQKLENIRKIKDLIEKKGKITNNEVEQLLKISDSSATRYLDILEKEGFIEQVGSEGRSVFYEKK